MAKSQGPCQASDCSRTDVRLRRGLCSTHYSRLRRHGDFTVTLHRTGCSVVGCDRPHHSSGWCERHYKRSLYTGGDPTPWQPARAPKVDSEGYRRVWAPEAPCAMADGWAKEHRLVMEQALGRPLRPEETVHHRNGVRLDNRLANLELWPSRHPSGQRIVDLLPWALEMVVLYRPDLLKDAQHSPTPKD